MFLSKISFRTWLKNNDPCLNGVSIVFWNGCDVKTFDIWAFTKKAKQLLFTYRIPWVHLIINYCVDKLYLLTFDESVYVNHFHTCSLLFKQQMFLSISFGLFSQMNFQFKSLTSFHISLVPPHFTMLRVRPLCLI